VQFFVKVVFVKIKLDAIKNYINDLSKRLIKTIFWLYIKSPLHTSKGEKMDLISTCNKEFVEDLEISK
jgi:hypothetical protein